MKKSTGKGAGSLVLLLCFWMTLFGSACHSVSGSVRDADGSAAVTKYYTYGLFFQLEGRAEPDRVKDVTQAELVLEETGLRSEDAFRMDVLFRVEKQKLTFWTSSRIDEGICLDTLETGTFAAFLDLTREDGSTERLALSDETGDGEDRQAPIEYYTLSHGHGHRKVTTSFEGPEGQETLVLRVKRSRLPGNVYDVVIDPGHGGKDPGAQSAGYREADVVLDLGKALQSALEREGYKVLLVRDGTEDPDLNMARTIYDEDGRVNRTIASKAKVCFSLHLNENASGSQAGVQIYRAKKASDAFAKSVADRLVSDTDLGFSNMAGKTVPGVYTRTFSAADIRTEQAKARKKGYTFYEVTTATDYYFMVREYGGIATGAYVDGRNPDYGENRYRDSAQGVEGLLCELGFLSNEHDRQVLLNDSRGIARAMSRALDDYADRLYENKDGQRADLLAEETL